MFHDVDVGQPVNVAYLFSESHEFGIESLELPGHFVLIWAALWWRL